MGKGEKWANCNNRSKKTSKMKKRRLRKDLCTRQNCKIERKFSVCIHLNKHKNMQNYINMLLNDTNMITYK